MLYNFTVINVPIFTLRRIISTKHGSLWWRIMVLVLMRHIARLSLCCFNGYILLKNILELGQGLPSVKRLLSCIKAPYGWMLQKGEGADSILRCLILGRLRTLIIISMLIGSAT